MMKLFLAVLLAVAMPAPALAAAPLHVIFDTAMGNDADDALALAMLQVGFSRNLARLIESKPDRYSPLSGMDLVKKKVRLLTVMAGNFAQSRPEYNVMTDIPAAQKLFAGWPTDIYFSGFEVGLAI